MYEDACVPLVTHLLIWCISLMVWGRGCPKLSGRKKVAKADTAARVPSIILGRYLKYKPLQEEREIKSFVKQVKQILVI